MKVECEYEYMISQNSFILLFFSPTFSCPIRFRSRHMPIQVRTTASRLDEVSFGKIAYDVMRCVFDIHNEFGRFFDEKIYKRELVW